MLFNTSFNDSYSDTMDKLMQSAQARYERKPKSDNAGASNTIFNMAKTINRESGNRYVYAKLKPLEGTFEQAKQFRAEGKLGKCLSVLRYIEIQMLYGRYSFSV